MVEWNVINDQKPIWCRTPTEVKDEEYQSFYKNITNDYSESLAHKHFRTEGQLEFSSILYVPERPEHDLFDRKEKSKNIFDLEERTALFGESIIEFVKLVSRDQVNNVLIGQIVRSGTSIGANYMEADAAESKKDFRLLWNEAQELTLIFSSILLSKKDK